ncbi:MAG TPA: glycosyltransferase [Pyrinomonadaceae bacterium]|nr:glycosyltransferase [Pyrinomonadaceae bacterium]
MISNIGVYNLHMRAMGGGEKLTLVLAEHLSLAHNVFLFSAEPLDVPSLEQFFDVDLSRVKVICLKNPGSLSRVLGRINGSNVSLHHERQLRSFELDLFINNSYASALTCPTTRGIFMCMFPHPLVNNVVNSYSTIVAISRYAADWVWKRWDRHSEVLYPPCDDMGPPPSAKEKIILHVGRFIADSIEDERHHKGQGLLLETFKRMTDLHQQGWELHFTGSLSPDGKSRTFAGTLMRAAEGLPVFFHFNAASEELRKLYRSAAIYWHATGYGFDADKYPAKQEHFGISTVEAMSAGAVPVVYATGGQKEIVTDEVDGYWWTDIDRLVNQTRKLANDATLRSELGHQAVLSSKRFSRETFVANIDRLIELCPADFKLK